MDRPQVRTRDGFVLRRTGGYNIYEMPQNGACNNPSIAIGTFARDLKDPRQTHHCFAVCCRLI